MNTKETLKSKNEISDLFRSGKRFKTKNLQIVYKKNNLDLVSILYCTDKSVKKAHQRNRVKRVLKAICFDLLNFPSSFNIAIISNFQFTLLPSIERKRVLENLITKIK